MKTAYLVFLRIATQSRKSHTAGKSLNMPEATDKCKTILGVQQSYKQAKKYFNSMSDNRIKKLKTSCKVSVGKNGVRLIFEFYCLHR